MKGPISPPSGPGSESVSAFQQSKIALGQLLGLPKDALHIYAGLVVFLATAALLRRPLGSWVPIGAPSPPP